MTSDVRENLRIAREIVDSFPVLRVYAASEWDELDENGQLWIAEIVAETRRRFAPQIEGRKRCHGNLHPAPFALTPPLVGRIVDALPPRRMVVAPIKANPSKNENHEDAQNVSCRQFGRHMEASDGES